MEPLRGGEQLFRNQGEGGERGADLEGEQQQREGGWAVRHRWSLLAALPGAASTALASPPRPNPCFYLQISLRAWATRGTNGSALSENGTVAVVPKRTRGNTLKHRGDANWSCTVQSPEHSSMLSPSVRECGGEGVGRELKLLGPKWPVTLKTEKRSGFVYGSTLVQIHLAVLISHTKDCTMPLQTIVKKLLDFVHKRA